jgi:hypothetical protein
MEQQADSREWAVSEPHRLATASGTGLEPAGGTGGTAVEPASRRARIAAYASAVSGAVGFIPLHLVWAFGIPLFADEELFRPWHADGGGPYLFVLNAIALLPVVLALALVHPWGLVFPSWVPVLAGRPVPRRLLVVSGFGASTLMLLYAGYASVLGVVLADHEDMICSPWIAVSGVPLFLVGAIGLCIATRSSAAPTRPARP